jgi:hypothetical protein
MHWKTRLRNPALRGSGAGVFPLLRQRSCLDEAHPLIGLVVSFTGILTFKNGQNVRDTLAATLMIRLRRIVRSCSLPGAANAASPLT